MAFEHYIIVRDSDLYEYKGLTKPVLMTIAHLIISEPEEDERGKVKGERDPDAGWCVAGQDYIAAALGMSPDSVSSIVNVLKTDDWLEVVAYRTRRGYMKNKYRIPADKLEEMKARARKKDEFGNFVREKQEKKVRNLPRGKDGAFLTAGSRKGPLRQVDERPDVTEPQGLTASCGGPCGTEPSSVGFSGLSQQVYEPVKQADTDNTLRSDQGDPGPQKSKAFQFDEDDEPSTPVQPSAPQARVIPPPAPRCRACKSVLKSGQEIATGRCEACQEKARKEQEKLDAQLAELRRVMGTHTWDRRYTCMNCQVHQDDIHYGTAGECPGARVKSAAAGAEDIELPQSKAFELED